MNGLITRQTYRETGRLRRTWHDMRKMHWFYFMLIPGIVYYIIFAYIPMWGTLFAFMDYSPFLGIFGSPWVGLKHFEKLFGGRYFGMLLRNTVTLSILDLLFYFPAPILLALLLNELRSNRFKRIVQSVTYLPHFMSAVIVVSIFRNLLSSETGVVNYILNTLGFDTITFLTDPSWFRPIYIVQSIWKEVGWGTIIFMAALCNIDMALYEAAVVDGANRWQQFRNITLPSIMPTVIILLILRIGTFLNTGYETVLLMQNSMNHDVSEVFDTYVYRIGITNGQYSFSTAVGLFKSVVAFILVYSTNLFAKKQGYDGLF